jgi:predicted enzyme related to lactoylglutathione lyase
MRSHSLALAAVTALVLGGCNGVPDMAHRHHTIDYIEFAAPDLAAVKRFYESAFGWKFTDYGPDYCAFEDGRINGGFYHGDKPSSANPLVVLYGNDLEATEARIVTAGGEIVARHDFPGGRRFHFKDTNGIEWSVWSDRRADGTKIE